MSPATSAPGRLKDRLRRTHEVGATGGRPRLHDDDSINVILEP